MDVMEGASGAMELGEPPIPSNQATNQSRCPPTRLMVSCPGHEPVPLHSPLMLSCPGHGAVPLPSPAEAYYEGPETTQHGCVQNCSLMSLLVHLRCVVYTRNTHTNMLSPDAWM